MNGFWEDKKMTKDSIYKRYEIKSKPSNNTEEWSYWFIFYKDKLLIDPRSDKRIPHMNGFKKSKVSSSEMRYFGTFEERSCYLAEIESLEDMPEGFQPYDLRSLYFEVAYDVFLLAGKAFHVMNWNKTHRFCGRCGTAMNELDQEMAKVCPKCGLINYTRISPAVIVGIIKGDKILLAHSSSFRNKMYSILAGYVEPGETLEDGVQREVMEEVGIKIRNIKYFGSQAWPFSSSLMIGFTAEYESGEIAVDHNEITDAAWFDVNNLPELPAEYSIAREIIDSYIKTNKPSMYTETSVTNRGV